MKTVYIEKAIKNHPRTQRVLDRLGEGVQPIECEHYGEVFNSKGQNFRIQKQNPALILAEKTGKFVLKTPEGFGIGGEQNYYFSHMLNCLYDCRYCFLQGMYPSANHLLFINYEAFMDEISEVAAQHKKPVYFFSGYDCDSLAYEPMTQFVNEFIPFFAKESNAILELRSKSTNINSLLNHSVIDNCVVAFSFTPERISNQVEHKVPTVAKRIAAMKKVADAGWRIGLRLDPLIYAKDFKQQYEVLINTIFAAVNKKSIHSVSVGPMRFPVKMQQKLVKLYPQDKLLAQPLVKRDKVMTYPEDIEQKMKQIVLEYLSQYLDSALIFECRS